MELDRAEAATQELLTAAEQLQRENTQLSAENEVCKLLGPIGCRLVTVHKPESRHRGPNNSMVWGIGALAGCLAAKLSKLIPSLACLLCSR